MAIIKSPFSQSGDGQDSNQTEWEKYLAQSGESVGGTVSKGIAKPKSTLVDELNKLDKAALSAKNRIYASPNMSASEKEKAVRHVEDLIKKGGWSDNFSFSGILNWGAGSVKYAAGKLFEGGATASRFVQSGIKELGDATLIAADKMHLTTERAHRYVNGLDSSGLSYDSPLVYKPTDPELLAQEKAKYAPLKVSGKEFVQQGLDKNFRPLPQTGIGWLDSTADFAIDVAFDPLTYAGVGETAWIGKSGKIALAEKMMTTEMLAKYPQLVGLGDDIVRYGEWAIPKAIRDAEGIKVGLRFAGQVIPNTEVIAEVVGKNILGASRRAIGDFAVGGPIRQSVRELIARKSMKPFIEAGIGRGLGVGDEVVVRALAENTARRYAKGATREFYYRVTHQGRQILDEVKQAGQLDNLYKYIEDPVARAAAPAHIRDLADKYIAWQNGIREEVNSIYGKFGLDFGAETKNIGFVDDYLHHRLTDRAKEIIFNKKYASAFKDADLSADEITGVTGALRHRQYTVGEKFMGEEIKPVVDGGNVIDQMNDIFRRKTGLDANFFETDLSIIADSYAYSMAKARGRETYIRRALDFGDNAVQIIGKKTQMDKELVAKLSASHTKLLQVRNALSKKVRMQYTDVKKNADAVLRYAEKILSGKSKQLTLAKSDLEKVLTTLKNVEAQLLDAQAVAATKEAGMRAGFSETHKVLLEEVQALRAAIETNTLDQYTLTKELQQLYLAVYPNTRKVPTDIGKLYEGIMQSKGVASPRELFQLEKRQKEVSRAIEELTSRGVPDAEQLNALVQEEQLLKQKISAFDKLGSVRQDATYSESGFVFTTTDSLDSGAAGGFKTYDSRIIDPNGGEFDPTRSNYVIDALNDPNTVAVHAIPQKDLTDLRSAEEFQGFFGRSNGSGSALADALDNAGLTDLGEIVRNEWEHYVRTGAIDPNLALAHPEISNILEAFTSINQLEFPTGVVPDQIAVDVFENIKHFMNGVAASKSLPESDVVGQQLFSDWLTTMATTGKNPASKGLVVPSGVVYGAENTSAMGAYSVILPNEFSYTSGLTARDMTGLSAKIQPTSTSEMVRSIISGDYEQAGTAVNQAFEQAKQATRSARSDVKSFDQLSTQADLLAERKANTIGEAKNRVQQAQTAYEQYQRTGTITFKPSPDAPEVTMTRQKALSTLAQREKKIASLYNKLSNEIETMTRAETTALLKQKVALEERLPSLLSKVRVLQRWDETTGEVLRADIDLLRTTIAEQPPRGAAGEESRRWMAKVQRAIDSTAQIKDRSVAKAYERIVTQLHADEVQLALYDSLGVPASQGVLKAAKAGEYMPKIVDDVFKGWNEIEKLGVMVPDELYTMWKPNLEKLIARGERNAALNKFSDAFNWTHRFFKTWAMATPGFGTRNAMSATFMNWVAGVKAEHMIEGAKAAIAYRKYGPVEWLNHLGLSEADKALYAEAWRVAEATGHGMADELAGLYVKKTFGEKLINNRWTQFWGNKMNTEVERMVRLPMALDSLKRGQTFDEAVTRITRYHFDYSDLSWLDEKAKSFIPFWIWTSRNIPLQMTEMFNRPSAYATWDKLEKQNPVNAEIMMPKWMSEYNPMGIGGNWIAMPDMPMNRLEQSLEAFTPSRIAGQMYAEFKLPMELLVQNKQAALDIPFSDKYEEAKGLDKVTAWIGANVPYMGALGRENPETGALEVSQKAQYVPQAVIPLLAQLNRLTGGATGGKASYSDRQLSSILGYFGVPARQVSESQQRGEAIRRQFGVGDLVKQLVSEGKVPKK